MAAGSALHRVLETFDFTAEPGAEVERHRASLPDLVRLYADGDEEPRSLARAERLLDRFTGGRLFARFVEIGPRTVARELPVILPPGDDDEAVGYLAGVIDLLYRDPSSGELVVADFKTDLVASAAAAAEHSRRYAAQGEVYVRAVAEMLGLPERPRFELWYLDADCLVSSAL